MSSPMVGVAFINAIVFGVYGNTQRRMNDPDALSSHFIAGITAGVAQSFVSSPMELAKTRLQIQRGDMYRSCLHCILQIARTDGVRGVYRGLGITMFRDAPGMGVYFLSYELMTRSSSAEPITTTHVMVAGGVAGSISWVSTFPFDVLKSRLQVDGMYGPAKYSGALDCFRQSVKSEGYGFIVRGLTSTLIRAFPVNAATFAGVTWVFRLAGVGSSEKESSYYVATSNEEEPSNINLYHPLPGRDTWSLAGSKLWGNWENKALTGLFHWRKLMINSIEGSFLADYHRNALATKFSQPETKSQPLSIDCICSEDTDLEDDTECEDNTREQVLDIPNQSLQDHTIELITDGAVDTSILKENYRISKQENG
ncbi:mitochondrial basic amino acids transporter isoform X2 [Anabrus simplex]